MCPFLYFQLIALSTFRLSDLNIIDLTEPVTYDMYKETVISNVIIKTRKVTRLSNVLILLKL
jgi:hypothetical protein